MHELSQTSLSVRGDRVVGVNVRRSLQTLDNAVVGGGSNQAESNQPLRLHLDPEFYIVLDD